MNIQEYVPLSDKTWFQTGGSARYFCQPATSEQFQESVQFAREKNLEIFVLGQGANILISDDGFSGLVIQPMLTYINIVSKHNDTALVCAGAGARMHDLITFCLSHNLLGLEEFSGIPGTVGGSVYINLHYFTFLLEQFIVSAQVIHVQTGEIQHVSKEWFQFGYNWSRLHEQEYYVVDATFQLNRATDLQTAFAQGRHAEIIRYRSVRYPTIRTCGSFFRNFKPEEVLLSIDGKKVIWVAYYLDKIGVKGALSVGGATVSYQHANMIVNRGNASSQDIIQLAKKMQQLVFDAFGIMPQPECQLIGFNTYPLLR